MATYILICLAYASQSPALDANALRALVEGCQSSSEDVTFEYEGQSVAEADGDRVDQRAAHSDFSGLCRYNRRNFVFVDEFHEKTTESPVYHSTMTLRGEKYEVFALFADSRQKGGVMVDRGHHARAETRGRPGFLLSTIALRGYLADPETRMRHVGAEMIDGHRCEVIEFSNDGIRDWETSEKAHVEKFWLDLARGGYALRREVRWGRPNLSYCLERVVLSRFELPNSKIAWLPTSGVESVHARATPIAGQFEYSSKPVSALSLYVLRPSVQFNQGLRDADFELKVPVGTVVNDNYRRLRYEFGRPKPDAPRPTLNEAQAQLKKTLADANDQAKELKATSRDRAGSGWLGWTPWASTGLAVIVIVFLLIQRRR